MSLNSKLGFERTIKSEIRLKTLFLRHLHQNCTIVNRAGFDLITLRYEPATFNPLNQGTNTMYACKIPTAISKIFIDIYEASILHSLYAFSGPMQIFCT